MCFVLKIHPQISLNLKKSLHGFKYLKLFFFLRFWMPILVWGVSYVYGGFHTRMGQLKHAFEVFHTRIGACHTRMGRETHFFQIWYAYEQVNSCMGRQLWISLWCLHENCIPRCYLSFSIGPTSFPNYDALDMIKILHAYHDMKCTKK